MARVSCIEPCTRSKKVRVAYNVVPHLGDTGSDFPEGSWCAAWRAAWRKGAFLMRTVANSVSTNSRFATLAVAEQCKESAIVAVTVRYALLISSYQCTSLCKMNHVKLISPALVLPQYIENHASTTVRNAVFKIAWMNELLSAVF